MTAVQSVVLGIDPGITGALALIGAGGAVVDVQDMPTLASGVKARRMIDAIALRDLLARYAIAYHPRPLLACIEQVSAQPTDGRAGAFSFGRSLGTIEAVTLCAGLPLLRVQPAAWKRFAGIAAGAGKEASIEAALRLHPSARPWLTRRQDHGRADAILIAAWAAQRARGEHG